MKRGKKATSEKPRQKIFRHERKKQKKRRIVD